MSAVKRKSPAGDEVQAKQVKSGEQIEECEGNWPETHNQNDSRSDAAATTGHQWQQDAGMNGSSVDSSTKQEPPDFTQDTIPSETEDAFASGQLEQVKTEEVVQPTVVVEEDHKVYLAPKRKTLMLNDEILNDVKLAFAQSGIIVTDMQSHRRSHVFMKVQSADDVEKAVKEFDGKLIAGVGWTVKRRVGKAELHHVCIRPTNTHITVDDELTEEVAEAVRKEFHVVRHYVSRNRKEVVLGMENEDERDELLKRFQSRLINHLEYSAVPFVDSSEQDSDAEPFLFASIRGGDDKLFDESIINAIKNLMEHENIELKRSNITANRRFAFFFLTKWEDATKFVDNYDNKVINENAMHFEKGQPKSRDSHRGRGGYRGHSYGHRGGYQHYAPPVPPMMRGGGPPHRGGYGPYAPAAYAPPPPRGGAAYGGYGAPPRGGGGGGGYYARGRGGMQYY